MHKTEDISSIVTGNWLMFLQTELSLQASRRCQLVADEPMRHLYEMLDQWFFVIYGTQIKHTFCSAEYDKTSGILYDIYCIICALPR